jgi:hypothetical protein
MSASPTFNDLYDCAQQLGTCEVLLEHIPYEHRRPGLAVVVRRSADGADVHRAVARGSVEEAAPAATDRAQERSDEVMGPESSRHPECSGPEPALGSVAWCPHCWMPLPRSSRVT